MLKKVLITGNHHEQNIMDTPISVSSHTFTFDCETNPFFKEGLLPLVLPAENLTLDFTDAAVQAVDLIVLTGGWDVNPQIYEEEVKYSNVKRYLYRDELEINLIESAIKNKKPIFAMCRGSQLLNVYFGGNLYQNIREDADTKVLHSQGEVHKMAHKNHIEKDSFLYDIYKSEEIWVNSSHNQAIKTLGKDLKYAAKSSDGIIEAYQHVSLPIYGVVWHPEFSYEFDENSKRLIQFACKLA